MMKPRPIAITEASAADGSPGNPINGTKRDHGDGVDEERQDRHPAEPDRQGDERAAGVRGHGP
jgi:hypothetical protein